LITLLKRLHSSQNGSDAIPQVTAVLRKARYRRWWNTASGGKDDRVRQTEERQRKL